MIAEEPALNKTFRFKKLDNISWEFKHIVP
jgi:hypothetical protein